ncbi:RRQRL motif-containing zinc-binding protein [Actinokineospora inagensis]|uniref:RRQRL motif-containing zinc-binding protein n=1 Tax=Actinokineospora inagensis TaxID=103730 RepID=UPI00047AE01F|nr:RRQRL motif-containing zinc-binding protein [Actinokineospora inagensis]
MAGRQYPWVLADVAWSAAQEFTRGTHLGLPLLSWGIAPRDLLATRRQLRARGLRPGGQEPVAYLYFRCRAAEKKVYAELFLISLAKPHRPATPAQHTALAKANLGRRLCRSCGRDAGYVVPLETRQCTNCWLLDQGIDPTAEHDGAAHLQVG